MLVCMKTKNMKELQKRWADQAKKATKPQGRTAAKKKSGTDVNKTGAKIVGQDKEDFTAL
jgi:hypothetical protein